MVHCENSEIHFSYEEKGNNELNFSQKIRNSKLNWICGAQET